MERNQRIHIAICDDEQIIRNLIKTYILEQYEDCSISEYASGEKLLEACLNTHEKPDLLFLDIEFPDRMNGMDIAKKIRAMDAEESSSAISSLPLIIFVTGDASRMPDAFRVHAFQYLVKPLNRQDFQRILKQAIRELHLLHKNDTDLQRKMTVRCDGGIQSIPIPDIDYFESEGRKLTIHTKGRRFSYYG